MNEKEAREVKIDATNKLSEAWYFGEVQGYLEAIEKAKELSFHLEHILKLSEIQEHWNLFPNSMAYKNAKEALAKWEKEK